MSFIPKPHGRSPSLAVRMSCRGRPPVGSARRWVWPIAILLLALALRLIWVGDAGFIHDVLFFVRWMRLARDGVGHLFAVVRSSYPPLTVYLLGMLGLLSGPAVLDAPATLAELLTLRATTIAFDLLTIAVLYALGRRVSSLGAGTWAALLYAVCPGGIYLSGWWVQIEAWFVLPTILGVWWLTDGKVALAWVALALAAAMSIQSIVVLPVFALGTWRWWGGRRLAIGCAALVLTVGVVAAPLLMSGQAADLVSKPTFGLRHRQWITLETHNIWFAVTARARGLGGDANSDLNVAACGISYRDVGLALLTLGYALTLGRLFIRSGPRAAFSACAVAWIAFYMLPTRVDARYLFPALALMLCAGFDRQHWWGLYGVAAVTLFINLVWKSRDISPLVGALPLTEGIAVINAWANVALLCSGIAFYIAPLLGPAQVQAETEGSLQALEHKWEAALLSAAVTATLVTVAVAFWRGRTTGTQLGLLGPPLQASLDSALSGDAGTKRTVVVNWPRTISADRSVFLGGIIPVTPPALFLPAPEAFDAGSTWVQYPPWQEASGLEVEYHGTYVTQGELAALAQSATDTVVFSPRAWQMILLAQERPAVAPSACLVRFDDKACLAAAVTSWSGSLLEIELAWQVTGRLSPDETVFVHVLDADGHLVTQADGDPAGGLIPLGSREVRAPALRETRLVDIVPGNHRVRIGVYDRVTGHRLGASCGYSIACTNDAAEIVVPGPER